MHAKHVYEYAVIRVLPVVEREEFLNVGIIMFCKNAKYIAVHVHVDESRLLAFCPDLDVAQVKLNLQSFEYIAIGNTLGGEIAAYDLPSRFRWLTAVRSSAIQTSRPHPGLCDNLDETAQRLFAELVL